MIQFAYDLNSESVEKALAAFQAALADETPALQRIADDFREMITRQFSTEGRAEGTPWAALAPSTARRRGPGSSLLYSTGALLRSLREPGAPDHVEELDEQSLTLGSRRPYALFHQTGTRKGLPARPMIVLSGARTERWLEFVRQRIAERGLLLEAMELGS